MGIPADWPAIATPEAGLIAFGDPLGAGVISGFVCKLGENGAVPLYTIDVLPLSPVSDHEIDIEMHQPPIDPRASVESARSKT